MIILQSPLLCKGWGGHPLCPSRDSSVLMDLHWPCDCAAQCSILSIGSVSDAFSWTAGLPAKICFQSWDMCRYIGYCDRWLACCPVCLCMQKHFFLLFMLMYMLFFQGTDPTVRLCAERFKRLFALITCWLKFVQ